MFTLAFDHVKINSDVILHILNEKLFIFVYHVLLKIQLNEIFSGGLNTKSHQLLLIVNQLKLKITLFFQILSQITKVPVLLNAALFKVVHVQTNNTDHVLFIYQEEEKTSIVDIFLIILMTQVEKFHAKSDHV
jgi:hypothetical protein